MTGVQTCALPILVPLVAVHMFCFYYGIMADVTPPVGLASFAAAAISGADPLKTGLTAFFYSLRTALLPFLFIFNTDLLLVDVTAGQAIFIFFIALTAMLVFAAGTMGYFVVRSRWWESLALIAVAFVLFRPGFLLNQITPEYRDASATEVYQLAEQAADNSELRLILEGENIDGDFVSSTYLLPVGNAGVSGERRLEDGAGLTFREEEGKYLVDMVGFGKPAEQAGVDFDWQLVAVQVPNERLPKEIFYLPALALLGLIIMLQRRRKQQEVTDV